MKTIVIASIIPLLLMLTACSVQPTKNSKTDNDRHASDLSDTSLSLEAYEKSCNSEKISACAKLGLKHDANGDIEQAIPHLQTACDGGYGITCSKLGMYSRVAAIEKNNPNRIADFEASANFYQSACDTNHFEGCRMLGSAYQSGEGVAKDGTKAVQLYHKACDGNNIMACSLLATAYEHGQSVEPDEEKAMILYSKACDKNERTACRSLHLAYVRSCDTGSAEDCMKVSKMYVAGKGLGHDYLEIHLLDKAAIYDAKACENGMSKVCKKNLTRDDP